MASEETVGFAHELWALAQLGPTEGIEDAVSRIVEALVAENAKPPSGAMVNAALNKWTEEWLGSWREDVDEYEKYKTRMRETLIAARNADDLHVDH